MKIINPGKRLVRLYWKANAMSASGYVQVKDSSGQTEKFDTDAHVRKGLRFIEFSVPGSALTREKLPATIEYVVDGSVVISEVVGTGEPATPSEVLWDDIIGRPSEFTPTPHAHTFSEITDIPVDTSRNVAQHTGVQGDVVIDASVAGVHEVKASGPINIILEGLSPSQATPVRINLTPGTHEVTWPRTLMWPNDTPPVLSSGKNVIGLMAARGNGEVYGEFRGGGYVSAIPEIGAPFMGGFFAGIIDTTKGNISPEDSSQEGQRYALIVSPKGLESPGLAWQYLPENVETAKTRWDGLAATHAINSDDYLGAAKYCADLSFPSDGGSSWYLPALDELDLAFQNFKPVTTRNTSDTLYSEGFPFYPGAEGYNPSSDPMRTENTNSIPSQTLIPAFRADGAEAFSSGRFWSSTQGLYTSAWTLNFQGWPGRTSHFVKTQYAAVRPVRRLIL